MTVGERIREVRKSKGLTQAQLAEKSGVATITIHQYEAGKRIPRLEQLVYLASALEIDPSEFAQIMGLEQIDRNLLAHEAGPEVYRKLEETYQRHHGAQARANKAMEQMTEEGQGKVADYAEDILPRYRRQEVQKPDTPDTLTPDAKKAGEAPQEPPEEE